MKKKEAEKGMNRRKKNGSENNWKKTDLWLKQFALKKLANEECDLTPGKMKY